MSVRVAIPPVLRSLVGGRRELVSCGKTIDDLLRNLAREYPRLALHLFDEAGTVRRYVLCIHNAIAVRPAEFASHGIGESDEIIITNALAGG